MRNKNKRSGFTPQENLISILPSVVAGITILSATIIMALAYFPSQNPVYRIVLILYGVFGSLYLAFFYFIFTASLNKARFSWITALVGGLTLGSLMYLIPEKADGLLYALLFIASLSVSIISNRGPAYVLVLIIT